MIRSGKISAIAFLALLSAGFGTALALPPDYVIVDIGVIHPGDDGSQGNAVSPLGLATGRTLGVSNQAYFWSEDTGLIPLPNFASRAYGVGNGVNDEGVVVGTGAATAWGADPLPLIWRDGAVAPLPLPAGESLGRAEDINNAGLAVGSVDGGSLQQAAVYEGGTAYVVTTTTSTGCWSNTLYGVNDLGLAAGTGLDPDDAARNVGFVYDTVADTAWEVGALSGHNGALCFGIGNGGHVVGSSMLYQGSGLPFFWTQLDGIQPVPLPAGTSQGSAKGVNLHGWVVGTASSAYAIPFLYDGDETYRVHDLLPAGSGWDLATNTFSSAMDISDEGIIVGTGVHEGEIRAYAMIPDDILPVLLSMFVAEGRDDGIELRWDLGPYGVDLEVVLERAGAADGPWAPVAAAVDGGGFGRIVLDSDTEPGRTYHYRLSAADAGGDPVVLGSVEGRRTAVGAAGVVLGAPSPNPLSSGTAVALRLPAAQTVQVTVQDLRGRLVRSLLAGRVASGETSLRWDGRDAAGRRVPAGVYLVRLQTAQVQRTQRVVVVR